MDITHAKQAPTRIDANTTHADITRREAVIKASEEYPAGQLSKKDRKKHKKRIEEAKPELEQLKNRD